MLSCRSGRGWPEGRDHASTLMLDPPPRWRRGYPLLAESTETSGFSVSRTPAELRDVDRYGVRLGRYVGAQRCPSISAAFRYHLLLPNCPMAMVERRMPAADQVTDLLGLPTE